MVSITFYIKPFMKHQKIMVSKYFVKYWECVVKDDRTRHRIFGSVPHARPDHKGSMIMSPMKTAISKNFNILLILENQDLIVPKIKMNLGKYKILYFQQYILRHDANVESEIERLKVNQLKIYLIRIIHK